MKKIERLPLSQDSRDELRSKQSKINAIGEFEARKLKARTLWENREKSRASKASRRAFAEIRELLCRMCNGPQLCMYCERDGAMALEHVKPRSRFPEATFEWENYLLACSTCNSTFKGDEHHDDFMDPSSPGYDLWQRWLFDPRTGHYSPRDASDEGAAETLRILGFDRRQGLADLRRERLSTLVVCIREYGKLKLHGRSEDAREFARTLSHLFPALVEWILVENRDPTAFPGLSDVRKVKDRFPEIVEDAFR